jgi:ribosomal protein S18 acetylase RimI-like enzyme
MDDATLFARTYASLREFYRLPGAGPGDSSTVELEGVTAAVVPATPDRSFMNSVVYETTADLERALPELADVYRSAGVAAWTVWVPDGDEHAAELLEQAGHVLDASPAAMAMELDSLTAPRPDLDLVPAPSLETVGAINDRAYDLDGGDIEPGIRDLTGLRAYVSGLEGRPVCCAAALDHGDDCTITLVATLPEARRRGLAAKLVTLALHDARDRGCTTTTLEATKTGYPVYLKLGYRDLGPIHMYERRTAA